MSKLTVNKRIYILYLLLFAIFLVTKMQRGFSESEEEGGIWNILQVVFVFSGIYISLRYSKTLKGNTTIRLYLIFMLYVWVLAVPSALFTSSVTPSLLFHLTVVPYGVFVFVLCYYLGLKNEITSFRIILSITYLLLFIILYLAMRDYQLEMDEDKGAVADVYYIVTLLPLIFIYVPEKYRIIPFLIAAVAVMMTGKRAAFIALAFILVTYFFSSQSAGRRKHGFLRITSFIIIVFISYYTISELTSYFNLNMFERLQNLESDGGSGRAERWAAIISMISYEADNIQLIIGNGYGAVQKAIGGHAHNDFLEFFYDYGVIALILYIVFYVSLLRDCLKMYKKHFTYANEFTASVVIAICMAMFSFYAIDSTHITCSSICLGLFMGEWEKYKRNGYKTI